MTWRFIFTVACMMASGLGLQGAQAAQVSPHPNETAVGQRLIAMDVTVQDPVSQPPLSIRRVGTNHMLSWPQTIAPDFGLQQASQLGTSFAWTNLTVVATPEGTNYTVNLPSTLSQGFYRLQSGQGYPALYIEQRSGNVSFPGRSSTFLSHLQIVSSLGTSHVTSNGGFTVPLFQGTPQLVLALAPGGLPMMMGWLDAGHSQLSARSTAEALVYFASGCFIMPKAGREKSMALIREMTELGDLETAISESLATDPTALSRPNARIQASLINVLTQVGFVAAAPSEGHITAAGISLDPAEEQSGIRVNLTGVNAISLRNRYRRAAYVFVDRDSYLGEDDKWHESPAALTEFEVPSVAGMSSTIGTFVDIINGKMAYAEVETDPVSLPVLAGSKVTRYKVNVIGFGQSDNMLRFLPARERDKQLPFTMTWFARDIFLPFLTSVIIPSLNLDGDYGRYLSSNDSLNDYVNVMTSTVPAISDKVNAGDLEGAFSEAWSAFFSSSVFQKKSLDLVIDLIEMVSPEKAVAGADALTYAQTILNTVGLADKILYGFDIFITVSGLKECHRGDQWTVDVSSPRVTLTPASSEIGLSKQVMLTAAVPDATGTGAPTLVYHWHNTALAGSIVDTVHTSSDFDSSDAFVWYRADLGKPGTDTITVQVFELKGIERVLLGQTNATVKVLGSLVTLDPATAQIGAGKTTNLTARIQPAPAAGTILEYQWSNTAHHGTLQSNRWSAVYTANADGNGDDTVEVEVFELKSGEKKSLGKAKAVITVKPYSVYLAPPEPSVGAGNARQLVTSLNPTPPTNWTFVYQWTNTARHGDLQGQSGPKNSFTNSESSATYTARTNSLGMDTVMVNVYRYQPGSNRFLGTAASLITVVPSIGQLKVPAETVLRMSGNYQFETAEVRGQILLEGDTTIEITYGLNNTVSNTHPTFLLNSGSSGTGSSPNGLIQCDFHTNAPYSSKGKGKDGYNLNLIIHGNLVIAGVFGGRIYLYGEKGGSGTQAQIHGYPGGKGGNLRLVVHGMIRTLSPEHPRELELLAQGGNGGLGWSGQAATASQPATTGGNGAPGGAGGSLYIQADEIFRVCAPYYSTFNVSGGGGGSGSLGGAGYSTIYPSAQGGDGADGGPAGHVEINLACRMVSQDEQGFIIEAIGGQGGHAGWPCDGFSSRGIPGLSHPGNGGDGGSVQIRAGSADTLMIRAMGGVGGGGSDGGIDWNDLPSAGVGGAGGYGGAGGQVELVCNALTYNYTPAYDPPIDARGGAGGEGGFSTVKERRGANGLPGIDGTFESASWNTALRADLQADPSRVHAGQFIDYTLNVLAMGTQATNVQLELPVPSGTVLVYASPGYVLNNDGVQWIRSSLAGCQATTWRLRVQVLPVAEPGLVLTNQARVSAIGVPEFLTDPVRTTVIVE